jgi:hypothetical protein
MTLFLFGLSGSSTKIEETDIKPSDESHSKDEMRILAALTQPHPDFLRRSSTKSGHALLKM